MLIYICSSWEIISVLNCIWLNFWGFHGRVRANVWAHPHGWARVREDVSIYPLDNFITDAIVRLSYGRPSGHRPCRHPSTLVRPLDNPVVEGSSSSSSSSSAINLNYVIMSYWFLAVKLTPPRFQYSYSWVFKGYILHTWGSSTGYQLCV
jgi:hypothetical protein